MGNLCGRPEAQGDGDVEGSQQTAHVTAISSAVAASTKQRQTQGGAQVHSVINACHLSRSASGILRLEKRGGHVNGDVRLDPKSKLAKYFTMYDKLPDDEGASLRAGATWLARSQRTGKLLHLRVLSLPVDFTMVPLVSREIEAISPALGAAHPNVVMGKQVMLTDRHFAVVMEVPAADNTVVTLAKQLGLKMGKVSTKTVPEDTARYFFLQLVSAVEHFHSKKLAHRQIDLANCLLDTSTEPPVLKLTDRGYGKTWRVDPRLTYSMRGFKTTEPLDLNSSIRSGNNSVRPGVSTSPESADSGRSQTLGDPLGLGLVCGGGVTSPSQISVRRPSLEEDDFCGCSRHEAEAADAFACGASLFALLVGAYPQSILEKRLERDPTMAPELVYEQCVSGWADHPGAVQKAYSLLSKGCKELLLRLFDPDEFARITLAEAKQHQWAQAIMPDGPYGSALAVQKRALAASRASASKDAMVQGLMRKELHTLVWKASNRADEASLALNRSGGGACPSLGAGLSLSASNGKLKDVETVGLSVCPTPAAGSSALARSKSLVCTPSCALAFIQETPEHSASGRPQEEFPASKAEQLPVSDTRMSTSTTASVPHKEVPVPVSLLANQGVQVATC